MRQANFGYILQKKAQYYPDRTALIDPEAGTALTYAELNTRADRVANALADRGIGAGDRIGGLFRNSPAFFEVFFGGCKLAAVTVPLNFRLAPPELEYMIENADPDLFMFESVFEQTVSEIDFGGRSLIRIDAGEGAELPTVEATPYADLLNGAKEAVTVPAHDFHDPAVILYTSGSTGRPKGVPLTHANLFFASVNYLVDTELTTDDVTLTSSPIFHVGGLNIFTLPLLHVGGKVVLQREFVPEETWEIMAEHDVTKMFTIPTMLNSMVKVDGWREHDLSSLELMVSGGEPVPTDLKEAFADIGVPVVAAYGLTETTDGTLVLRPEHAMEKGPKCNGKTFTHVDAKVVDDEGEVVSPGEQGELVHRGPSVATTYWELPEETADAWEDGWFKTGDIAEVDEDGFYHIYGRIDNMIITGGENVYPSEVEEALHSHPDVAEVIAFGVPSEEWGEEVKAVIVPRSDSDLSENAIDDFLEGRLAGYKQPKQYQFVQELPKSGTGKLERAAIIDRYGG